MSVGRVEGGATLVCGDCGTHRLARVSDALSWRSSAWARRPCRRATCHKQAPHPVEEWIWPHTRNPEFACYNVRRQGNLRSGFNLFCEEFEADAVEVTSHPQQIRMCLNSPSREGAIFACGFRRSRTPVYCV